MRAKTIILLSLWCIADVGWCGDVKWYKEIYPSYLNTPASTQEDLRALVDAKWEEDFTVKFQEVGVRRVDSCRPLIEYHVIGVVPSIPREYSLIRSIQVQCYALNLAAKLKTFSDSFLASNVRLEIEDIFDIELPSSREDIANLLRYIKNTEKKRIECSSNRCVIDGAWGDTVYVVELLARGDYNRDTKEDWVISITVGSSTGDPDTISIVLIVTRNLTGERAKLLGAYPGELFGPAAPLSK